ncbi:MAG: ABC transporter substrate-binding protein [Gammaproteobacteria bacterium]|nr:ABC transporter substrate-binding protein [Gammaproteobacteria bacterium]
MAIALTALLASPPQGLAAERVVSLNLCTDQLLLLLADREQIVSISWLGADPEESAYAHLAEHLPVNYGQVEQILPLAPDLVLAGSYTAPFTVALLERLGLRVLTLPPATSLDMLETHILTVAAALDPAPRGEEVVAELQSRGAAIAAAAPMTPTPALVVRAGGFTAGEGLTHELMTLAGLDNVATRLGLDRWGSLSVETLLRTRPEVLIIPRYRRNAPSLANSLLAHPALADFADTRTLVEPSSAQLGCETPALLDVAEAFGEAARASRPGSQP